MQTNLSREKISGNFLCSDQAPLCQRSDPRRPNEKSAGAKESGVLLLIAIVIALWLLIFIRVCHAETGTASYYTVESCLKESGQYVMANGKELSDEKFTCASWFYPFGTRLKVSKVGNPGSSIIVIVTDRGPAKRLVKKGRLLDLSLSAFSKLSPLSKGVIPVRIERVK